MYYSHWLYIINIPHNNGRKYIVLHVQLHLKLLLEKVINMLFWKIENFLQSWINGKKENKKTIVRDAILYILSYVVYIAFFLFLFSKVLFYYTACLRVLVCIALPCIGSSEDFMHLVQRVLYSLIMNARDPIMPINMPTLNIQCGGTAMVSSTNQKCQSSFKGIASIAATKPISELWTSTDAVTWSP